jgi:hypothetical protein
MLNPLSESEVHLIVQALDLLLASKQDAFTKVVDCCPALTPQDFGIPQIFGLMAKIDDATLLDNPESGVPA